MSPSTWGLFSYCVIHYMAQDMNCWLFTRLSLSKYNKWAQRLFWMEPNSNLSNQTQADRGCHNVSLKMYCFSFCVITFPSPLLCYYLIYFPLTLPLCVSAVSHVLSQVSAGELERLMVRLPSMFRQELSGVGATLEKRWKFCGFDSLSSAWRRENTHTQRKHTHVQKHELLIYVCVHLLPSNIMLEI